MATRGGQKTPALDFVRKMAELEAGEPYYTHAEALKHFNSRGGNRLPAEQQGRPYLRVHLEAWLLRLRTAKGTLIERKGAHSHYLLPKRSKEDGRRDLPKEMQRALGLSFKKIKVAWVACWLEGIVPDQTQEGWERFEHSHRCLNASCFWPAAHGCWESSSHNQSRGYRVCQRLCHCGCGKTMCEANACHEPSCLVLSES